MQWWGVCTGHGNLGGAGWVGLVEVRGRVGWGGVGWGENRGSGHFRLKLELSDTSVTTIGQGQKPLDNATRNLDGCLAHFKQSTRVLWFGG